MVMNRKIIDRTLATPHGEQAYRVVETLCDAGFEAWWVGGSTRDMLLKIVPDEIDIATSATPEDVQKLFPRSGASAAELGSTWVNLQGQTFEVTTFREETETSDGRKPTAVTYTTKQKDAARRDITINAIYLHPVSGEVFDPFDGETDLAEGLIRLIGNPDERIQHDALRLLRVIRFRARLSGQYHPDTYRALHTNAKIITILSGTRRFEEMEKMLLGPHPKIAFEDLWETDVLEHLIPELHACKGVAQPGMMHEEGDVWEHILRVIASFTDDHGGDTRWAALLHDIGKPKTFSIDRERIRFNEHASVGAALARGILDRLQCPGRRREKIAWLIEHHMMMGGFEEMQDERKAHWYHHPWFLELLQVFFLDIAGTIPADFSLYERIIDDYNHFLDAHPQPKKPLLTGEDVMEILGIGPGESVGRILSELGAAEIKKEVQTKAEARAFLEKHRNNLPM